MGSLWLVQKLLLDVPSSWYHSPTEFVDYGKSCEIWPETVYICCIWILNNDIKIALINSPKLAKWVWGSIVIILMACQVHENGSTFWGELKWIAHLIIQTSYNLLSTSDLAENLDATGYQAHICAWVVELLTDGKFMHGPCDANVSNICVTYHITS